MKNYIIFILLISGVLYSCKNDVQTSCKCLNSEWPEFPIIAIGDSVVICDTGKVELKNENGIITESYSSETDFLTHTGTMTGSERIYDCRTNKNLRYALGPYYKYYKDKSLVIEVWGSIRFWDTTSSNAITEFNSKYNMLPYRGTMNIKDVPLYREKIYAENDSLKISEKESILECPYISPKVFHLIDSSYQYFKDNVLSDKLIQHTLYELHGTLLLGALNGNKEHEKKLLNFKSVFPSCNENRLNSDIKILKLYQKAKR